MTRQTSEPKTVRKIVVIFDICSSTAIVEDLLRTESLRKWRDLLIAMKQFLCAEASRLDFEIYKFLGDGWILLFPEAVDGEELVQFLVSLNKKFFALYKTVERVLSTPIATVGLTFGIDRSTLIRVTMNHQREYIGRALNVASRLQSSVGDKDNSPQGKGLLSRRVFDDFGPRTTARLHEKHRVRPTTRDLRNISGGQHYRCMKLCLRL